MRPYFLAIFFLSFLIIAFSCVKEETDDEIINHVIIGQIIPEFTVSDGIGNSLHSENLNGKKTLLVFFSTTCPDCQRELPKIQAVWDSLKNIPDYVIITIARSQSKEITDNYWNSEGFTMPKYLDPDRSVFDLFANSTIPRIYIIDSKGIIRWMAVETLDLQPEELINKMKSLS